MFIEASCFPFTEELQETWGVIRSEFDSVQHETIPYLENDLYTGEWDVFPFLFFEKEYKENQTKCPQTWEALQKIPGLVNASFSILRQATEVEPHTGFTDQVLRCHLGLDIPHGCAIIVGNVPKRWQEGKCLIFDDTVEHYAYNKSHEDRGVLLLDFKK